MGCSIINILLFYRMGCILPSCSNISSILYRTAALLIVRVFKFQLWRRLISPILILTIICFGLVVSILLVTLNINSYQFKAQAVVVKRLNDNDTVFIGRQVYLGYPDMFFKCHLVFFQENHFPLDGMSQRLCLLITEGPQMKTS